jgi:hypothetical protein
MSLHDGTPTPQLSPDPRLEDDGSYRCDICHQKVRVGCGGIKNFEQHCNSPVCLKAKEKHESQANQAENKKKTLLSFFSKVTNGPKAAVATKGRSTHTNVQVLTKVRSSAAHTPTPTPTPPLPSPPLSYWPYRSDSAEAERSGCRHPDAYALTLLALT